MRVLLLAILVLFLVNTILVSAGAWACLHSRQGASPCGHHGHEVQVSLDSESPCHENQSKNSDRRHESHENQSKNSDHQHCEGFCLCVHTSSSPSFYLKSSEDLGIPMAMRQSFSTHINGMFSINQLPPKRPPKFIS